MLKQIQWLFLLTSFLFAAPIQDHKIDLDAAFELCLALNIPLNQWLRKSGQERWEIAELSSNQRLLVFNWAKEQGLFDPWKPLCASYDKALIFGATTPRMKMRLDNLKQLWEEGIRFKEIVWLTGDRPLDPQVDHLLERCKNESEAAQILWEETDLPEEMGRLPVLFVAMVYDHPREP